MVVILVLVLILALILVLVLVLGLSGAVTGIDRCCTAVVVGRVLFSCSATFASAAR